MNTILLYSIVLIISLFQIKEKMINKKKYELLPFMIATSCLIIAKSPQTIMEIYFSIFVSITFIIFMLDFFVITPISKRM